MLDIKTHQKINNKYCGIPIELKEGYSKVKLMTINEMVLDETGLIHGGFIFSLADYAAMLAINHPFVVLGGASVKFLRPVKKGEELLAEAFLENIEKKKSVVNVKIQRKEELVFNGEFYCYVPNKHVLDGA
ncbi:MAG TPA: hotdog domain-containing protein [Candidatus Lokiarchaeia archaeon]